MDKITISFDTLKFIKERVVTVTELIKVYVMAEKLQLE